MAFPITCPACGKAFQLAQDIYDKKVAGKVVSIKCKQCQGGIRVDATQPGELKVTGTTPTAHGAESIPQQPPAQREVLAPTVADKAVANPLRARQATLIGMMGPGGVPITGAQVQAAAAAAAAAAAGGAEGGLWAVDSGGEGDDRELSDAQVASELAQGTLSEATLVWREGMGDWQEIRSVPQLARYLPGSVAAAEPPGPQPPAPEVAAPAPPPPPPPPPPLREKQPSAPALDAPRPRPPSAPSNEAPRARLPSAPSNEAPRPKLPSAPAVEAPRARLPSAPGLDAPRPKPPSAPSNQAPRAKLPSAPSNEALDRRPAPPTFETPRAKLPSAPGIAVPGLEEEEATAIYDRSAPDAAKYALPGMPADAPPPPPVMPPAPLPAAGRPPPAPPPLPRSAPAASAGPLPAAPPAPPLQPQPAAPSAPARPVVVAAIPWGEPAPALAPTAQPTGVMPPNPFNVPATITDLDFPTERSKRPLVIGVLVAIAAVVAIIVAVSSSSSTPPIPSVAAVPAATPSPEPVSAAAPTATPTSTATSELPGGAATHAPGGGFSDMFAQGAQKVGANGARQPFDPVSARKALAEVFHSVAACKDAGGATGQTTASVTFESNGKVSNVTVGAPFAGTSTGTCIITALKRASMAPFSGLPGTVAQVVSLR